MAPAAPRESGKAVVKQNAPVAINDTPDRMAPPVPPAPLTEYYSAHELDVYPRLRAPLQIELADVLAKGRLTVSLSLSETGIVEDVALQGKSPHIADTRVRDALREHRFSPAIKNGRPVKSRITLNIESRLEPARPAE